jgi:hypothetical protein
MTSTSPLASIDLYWIPLGAGAHVVRLSGKAYEAIKASPSIAHGTPYISPPWR